IVLAPAAAAGLRGSRAFARLVPAAALPPRSTQAPLRRCDQPRHPVRNVTSDRDAGGRGGGRVTREGATKAELGGAELARAGTRPRRVLRTALTCRRPQPPPPPPRTRLCRRSRTRACSGPPERARATRASGA